MASFWLVMMLPNNWVNDAETAAMRVLNVYVTVFGKQVTFFNYLSVGR